jgi:hypothetical protein
MSKRRFVCTLCHAARASALRAHAWQKVKLSVHGDACRPCVTRQLAQHPLVRAAHRVVNALKSSTIISGVFVRP